MYLGMRRIRSAGRTSGSIELTLPTELHVLQGVNCRLVVRDGSRPEIILQPDLAAGQNLFRELWQKLRLGLGEIGEIGDFASGDFALALFPSQQWHLRPPLAYSDALALLQSAKDQPASTEAMGRLLAYLGIGAAYRLGLQGTTALAFGDAVAYVIAGIRTGLGTDFERGMAHRAFWDEGRAQSLGAVLEEQTWIRARSGLGRVFEQFRTWQEKPEVYTITREKWYKALAVEVGLGLALTD